MLTFVVVVVVVVIVVDDDDVVVVVVLLLLLLLVIVVIVVVAVVVVVNNYPFHVFMQQACLYSLFSPNDKTKRIFMELTEQRKSKHETMKALTTLTFTCQASHHTDQFWNYETF